MDLLTMKNTDTLDTTAKYIAMDNGNLPLTPIMVSSMDSLTMKKC